jgi:hypothetical protein
LRKRGAADVFRRNRTADVQAVEIGIAHVTQRNAIKRETELVLAEAANGKPGRPFVGAKRIGRLDRDAGQLFQNLQGLVPGVAARMSIALID